MSPICSDSYGTSAWFFRGDQWVGGEVSVGRVAPGILRLDTYNYIKYHSRTIPVKNNLALHSAM